MEDHVMVPAAQLQQMVETLAALEVQLAAKEAAVEQPKSSISDEKKNRRHYAGDPKKMYVRISTYVGKTPQVLALSRIIDSLVEVDGEIDEATLFAGLTKKAPDHPVLARAVQSATYLFRYYRGSALYNYIRVKE